MTNPLVTDISHHNPTPDWAKLHAGGTIGVICKAVKGAMQELKDTGMVSSSRMASRAVSSVTPSIS